MKSIKGILPVGKPSFNELNNLAIYDEGAKGGKRDNVLWRSTGRRRGRKVVKRAKTEQPNKLAVKSSAQS